MPRATPRPAMRAPIIDHDVLGEDDSPTNPMPASARSAPATAMAPAAIKRTIRSITSGLQLAVNTAAYRIDCYYDAT